MKIVYIAHPIAGDVKGNLEKIAAIVRDINLNEPGVIPFVPYYVDCVAMDDDIPAERARGIANGMAIIDSGMVHELWLYGHKISAGMIAECIKFEKMGLPVVPKSDEAILYYNL